MITKHTNQGLSKQNCREGKLPACTTGAACTPAIANEKLTWEADYTLCIELCTFTGEQSNLNE